MDYEIMMNGNVKIGTYAPDFEAETTMGKIELNQYKGKWVILFYPRVYNRDNRFCKSQSIF